MQRIDRRSHFGMVMVEVRRRLQRFRINLAPTRHRYAEQKRDKQARERRFPGNGADGRERLSWLARGHDGLA
jgi:hypothetical protein